MKESSLIASARDFALKAHHGQTRKLRNIPYFQHPANVAAILQKEGFRDEVVAAGFLHDVVEDTKYTTQDITRYFSGDVAQLVAGNTEDKKLTWEQRKKHTIHFAKTAPLEVKALIGADKLDNLRSILHEYKDQGEIIWTHFKRGKDSQFWYYSEVVKALFHNLQYKDTPSFFHELRELVDQLK